MSKIEWTDRTWNPCVGCEKVSAGCKNCYAEKQAYRVALMEHAQGRRSVYVNVIRGEEEAAEGHWNGRATFLPERLAQPLSWRKPCRIFVNSMSDLFHDDITNKQIAALWAIMAATPQHTYQVLTKRPARMLEWFRWVESRARDGLSMFPHDPESWRIGQMLAASLSPFGLQGSRRLRMHGWHGFDPRNQPWPLPNVHLGVSVEHQKAADERIPLLIQCPAALRFLSVEPLLEDVDLNPMVCPSCRGRKCESHQIEDASGEEAWTQPTCIECDEEVESVGWLDNMGWVIVGGESGPGARPCHVSWIESVIDQCIEAGVPVFVKQLGACPDGVGRLKDRKGGNPDEWPEHLRVRQTPLTDDELRELGAAFMEYDDAQR